MEGFAIKVFVDDNNYATMICPECGKAIKANVKKYITTTKTIKVKCNCSHVYRVSFEIRKFYRKSTNLPGTYINESQNRKKGDMIVKNLSLGGLKFVTKSKNDIKINDKLQIKFTLDNRRESEILKRAVVKNKYENFVGVGFLDDDYNKELGFYLMP